jgi:hypothetical protein
MSHLVPQIVLNAYVRRQIPRFLMRRVGKTRDSALRVRLTMKALPMRNILEQGFHSPGLTSTKSFILPVSTNCYQPRLGVKSPCDAGLTVLARLPEAPFICEPPSLTSSGACYRAVCEAWSAYTDLKISLPYLSCPAVAHSSPCVSQ